MRNISGRPSLECLYPDLSERENRRRPEPDGGKRRAGIAESHDQPTRYRSTLASARPNDLLLPWLNIGASKPTTASRRCWRSLPIAYPADDFRGSMTRAGAAMQQRHQIFCQREAPGKVNLEVVSCNSAQNHEATHIELLQYKRSRHQSRRSAEPGFLRLSSWTSISPTQAR
jgi:hypothetical protein